MTPEQTGTRRLERAFFGRSAVEVAPDLVGVVLTPAGAEVVVRIVETRRTLPTISPATPTAAVPPATRRCSARRATPTCTAPTGSTGV